MEKQSTQTSTETYKAEVIFGNHSSVIVPMKDRDSIRKFYCDVLGGNITKAEDERDILQLGENFILFLYGDVADESEFLRTARSMWLEIKTDNVEEMTRRILDFGVMKLDIPAPHLFFQAPGGQCWRLVGINEDLSSYEGIGEGTNVENVKEAFKSKEQNNSNNQNKSNKMEKQNYNVSITLNATPEQAFKSINSVSKWWTENVEGRSEKLNDEFIVRSGNVHYSKHKIIEVIPDKKVVWLVTDSKLNWIENNKDEWTNTKMVFEIIPNGKETTIKFTHEGLIPGQECYENCVKGWDSIIKQNLYNFVTKGEIIRSKITS